MATRLPSGPDVADAVLAAYSPMTTRKSTIWPTRSRKASSSTAVKELFEGDSGREPELSVYNVAALLGIGVTTVCQYEKSAISKLQRILQRLNVRTLTDLELVECKEFRRVLTAAGYADDEGNPPYPVSHGWFPVRKVVSVNDGTEDIREIALTHQLLNSRRGACFYPHAFVRAEEGTARVGQIVRVVEFRRQLRVQCKPVPSCLISRSGECPDVTLVVESETGTDSEGVYEVPVIMAAFIRLAPLVNERREGGSGQATGSKGG